MWYLKQTVLQLSPEPLSALQVRLLGILFYYLFFILRWAFMINAKLAWVGFIKTVSLSLHGEEKPLFLQSLLQWGSSPGSKQRFKFCFCHSWSQQDLTPPCTPVHTDGWELCARRQFVRITWMNLFFFILTFNICYTFLQLYWCLFCKYIHFNHKF